ncbi:MAG: acyl-CoA dehydrogenase family protein [Deltaproteobacteria bacterium]|nr:acyl-CoA dehydrogenase family protein [Deltaproteobacteria bacterium]
MTQPTSQGGVFLLHPVAASDFFLPEDLSPEQRQLAETTREFVEREVMVCDAEIEAKVPGVLPGLLKKAGALGLLMVEIPEVYGGMGLGKTTASAIAENATGQGSFIVALMCHTGIGSLPVLYYGTDEQKKRYLPRLATGELLGAYSLTESGAGSDALAAKTRAVKSPDGRHYLLTGEKIFVTNGGFADLYTVFAKVDGEHFTAFLVERTTEGLAIGREENKMGIHGSSTVPLFFQDAKVPVENVLGEIGKGHRIAFNILNVGRYKLGAACIGACKRLIGICAKYVQDRQQFGKPISSFEAIQRKIADCTIRTFVGESLAYRYAGTVDAAMAGTDMATEEAYARLRDVTKDLAIEASIVKVFGSEAIHAVADEAVQMHGGYGFILDYWPARYYQDNRINRLFEGTNEINRLLITGTLFRRIGEGALDFLGVFQQILGEIRGGFPTVPADAPLAPWQDQVDQLKKLVIYVGGIAINTFGPAIEERQQLLLDLADLIIECYAVDSAVARALKLIGSSAGTSTDLHQLIVTTYCAERIPRLKVLARQALVNIADGKAEVYGP